MPTGDEHIVGLDVTVHHTHRVRGDERLRDLGGETHGVGHWHGPRRGQTVTQRFARRHRHHVKQERAVAGDTRVEQWQDVRIFEPRRDGDLAEKAVARERLREFGLEHLDRNVAVVLEIVRKVHRGHAALAEFTLDAVTTAERRDE